MRRVNRNEIPGPASLLSAGQAGQRELENAVKHFALPPATKFPFRAYKGEDVRHTLEKLFFGKCAYCESRYDITGPVDIEHYRPKGEVEGVDEHPGYWWLAAEWTNLLPSCLDCNRRRYQLVPKEFASLSGALVGARSSAYISIRAGKESSFPIAGAGIRLMARPDPGDASAALDAEQALLLDPCKDDPQSHLRFWIDRQNPLGLVFPASSSNAHLPVLPTVTSSIDLIENEARIAGVSVHGAVSIQVYGLNRVALIQERTRVLRKLELLAGIVFDMFSVADSLSGVRTSPGDRVTIENAIARAKNAAARAIGEIKSMAAPSEPFSAMVQAWIDTFKADVSRQMGTASHSARAAAAHESAGHLEPVGT